MEEKTKPVEADWETLLIKHIDEEWEKGSTYCSDLNTLYDDIYAMIKGERPKKNYDWESNIVINKVFQVTWSAIAYLTNKIFSAKPVIGVKSFDKNGAWQRESVLEFWHTLQVATDKEHVDYFLVMVMWLLRGLLNGTAILKKTWHQKLKTISREVNEQIPVGKEEGELQYEENITKQTRTVPIEDWPHNEVCNNKDIVVDWNLKPGQSIKHGRFVIHRVPNKDIDSLKRTKLYENLDDFEGAFQSIIDQEHAKTKTEQSTPPPTSTIYSEIDVYERVGELPVTKTEDGWEFDPDDGDMKHMVAVIGKGGGIEKVIRLKPNRYGMINYIDMHIYFDQERWNSIGMAEPIMDMQTAMSDNINALFDGIWQNLFPPTIFNENYDWDWDTITYAPRQKWIGSFPPGVTPSQAVMFKEPSNVTSDAWRRHQLFDSEIQQTTVTNAVQGMGKEKTATTNVLNAQLSAGKLDFILKMVEKTALIPSAQMDIAFAKKFAHPLTFMAILGQPFRLSDWEEIYRYLPAASSVKLELQRESEVQQDIQLLQVLRVINNPNAPKIMNMVIKNIMRNRDWTEAVELLDEKYFEPQGDAGNLEMINRMSGASNEQGIEMSPAERNVRSRVTR